MFSLAVIFLVLFSNVIDTEGIAVQKNNTTTPDDEHFIVSQFCELGVKLGNLKSYNFRICSSYS